MRCAGRSSAQDYSLAVLQPRLPELGVLQLLEESVPVRKQPFVLSLETAGPDQGIPRAARIMWAGSLVIKTLLGKCVFLMY